MRMDFIRADIISYRGLKKSQESETTELAQAYICKFAEIVINIL